MEKISQLMDGELGRRETKATIELLESDQALAQSWETYHLIGDSLRREAELRPGFHPPTAPAARSRSRPSSLPTCACRTASCAIRCRWLPASPA